MQTANDEDLTKVVAAVHRRDQFQDALDHMTGGGQTEAEHLWARRLQDGLYEIRSIPVAVPDLNFGDAVHGELASDGTIHLDHVMRRSGHRTVWIIFDQAATRSSRDQILERLLESEAGFETSDGPFYAVDLPPDVDSDALLALLTQQQDRGLLVFKVAGGPDSPDVLPVLEDGESSCPGHDAPARIHDAPVWGDRADSVVLADVTDPGVLEGWEELPARLVKGSEYQLCCIPFFAYGIALGDIVATEARSVGPNIIREVIQRSGHWTIRVAFDETLAAVRPSVIASTVANVQALGCLIEYSSEDYLAIDAASGQVAHQVSHLLRDKMRAGELEYEFGQSEDWVMS